MIQYLDRKQVIELYEKYHPRLATCVYEFGQELRQLPIVEERPHGEWEWVTDDKYRCTNCGEIIQVKEVMNVPQYIACPMCEARMIYGHWISDWSESYGKDGFRCSICSRWSFEKKDKCDHCGIKMKEGEKE